MDELTPIEHARAARARKAECLRSLASGARRLPDTLRSPPQPLLRTSVFAVVVATYNMGSVGATQVCTDAGIWPQAMLHELTPAEVERIIDVLPRRAKR